MSHGSGNKSKCVFPFCLNIDSVAMFQIPKNEARRKMWLEICELSESEIKPRDVICKLHFKPEDFQKNTNKILLMPGAIPTRSTHDQVFQVQQSDINNFIVEQNSSDLTEKAPIIDLKNSVEADHDYATCQSCQKLEASVNHWRMKYHNLEVKYNELKSLPTSKSPEAKKFREDITAQRMLENGKFSQPQISVFLRHDKEKDKKLRSKMWTNQDFYSAKRILGMSSGSAALEFVRHIAGLPLPAESTCRKKFHFMRVERGFITPALLYLEAKMPSLPEKHRLACVKFDEMKVKETAIYDSGLDAVLGPHKYVQEILVRSLYGDWQYPVYIDYDMALTKEHYNQCILHLEGIKIKVLLSACDQGPRNVGLAKALGVSKTNVRVPNPYDSSRFVLFSYDFVHIFKNIRNHLLDDFFKLDGVTMDKTEFEDLLKEVNFASLRMVKLKPLHINCQQSDRQNVALAVQLLSNSVSVLLKEFFPECPKKKKLSPGLEHNDLNQVDCSIK